MRQSNMSARAIGHLSVRVQLELALAQFRLLPGQRQPAATSFT
jgi:hypothetical protein